MARRVEAILAIRIDGAQRHDILRFVADQDPPWNVAERTIEWYIGQADNLIYKRIDRKRSRVIALHLTARRALYARNVNAAQYGEALRALDSEAKLRGLFVSDAEMKAMKLQLAEVLKRMETLVPVQPETTPQHSNQGGKTSGTDSIQPPA